MIVIYTPIPRLLLNGIPFIGSSSEEAAIVLISGLAADEHVDGGSVWNVVNMLSSGSKVLGMSQ